MWTNLRLLAGLLLFFSLMGTASAKDLGTIGQTYEIAEQDMEEYIYAKLATLDWNKTMQEVIQKTKKQIIPKGKPLPRVKKYRVFYIDPTKTLDKDIKDDKGNIIHPKGKRYNVLDYDPFSKMYLFIDGDDPEQLTIANRYEDKFRHNVEVLLVNGDIVETMQENKKLDINYAKEDILKGFQIRRVPSLASQEGNKVKVEELVK